MKRLLLLLLIPLSGCAVYWTDDVFLLTLGKNYDLKNMTSTSQTVEAKATIKDQIEVRTENTE